MRVLFGAALTALLVAFTALGAGAQVTPPGATPATVDPSLYVPLRDAFLATLRANATTDQKFAYASALQKAQAGDLLGAQREAAQAMLSPIPTLPPAALQPLKNALARPATSLPGPVSTAPAPITIAPGPGVPQMSPQENPVSALAFARAEIELGEMRVGHPLEDARAAYVDATAQLQQNDAAGAIASATKAADLALDAYEGGP